MLYFYHDFSVHFNGTKVKKKQKNIVFYIIK